MHFEKQKSFNQYASLISIGIHFYLYNYPIILRNVISSDNYVYLFKDKTSYFVNILLSQNITFEYFFLPQTLSRKLISKFVSYWDTRYITFIFFTKNKNFNRF